MKQTFIIFDQPIRNSRQILWKERKKNDLADREKNDNPWVSNNSYGKIRTIHLRNHKNSYVTWYKHHMISQRIHQSHRAKEFLSKRLSNDPLNRKKR